MPYVAVNLTNDYDIANKTCYATQEKADTCARESLNQFASAQVCVPSPEGLQRQGIDYCEGASSGGD